LRKSKEVEGLKICERLKGKQLVDAKERFRQEATFGWEKGKNKLPKAKGAFSGEVGADRKHKYEDRSNVQMNGWTRRSKDEFNKQEG
jgi:hypothetical protein